MVIGFKRKTLKRYFSQIHKQLLTYLVITLFVISKIYHEATLNNYTNEKSVFSNNTHSMIQK